MSSNGKLKWDAPDDGEEPPPRVIEDSTASDSDLGPVTAEEEAVAAANRARIEELKRLPQGVDELEFGDLLHIAVRASRHSGPEVVLSVAGRALQTAGLVPIPIWDGAMLAAAGAIGLSHLIKHRDGAPDPVSSGSQAAEELWRVHPGFAAGLFVNMLHAIAQAAAVDDTELEDRLDAFYPRWSRTDFEFDLRRHLR